MLTTKNAPGGASPGPRILLLGAECTGKTTLIQHLAKELLTPIVPEYFRFYWESKRYESAHPQWHPDEFALMAREQVRLEEMWSPRARGVLLCDTGPIQLAAWQRYYLGASPTSQEIPELRRPYALIGLCLPDIPYVQDGVRAGDESREPMTQDLRSLLAAHGHAYVELRGNVTQRAQDLLMEARHLGLIR